jgi:ADP-ribose pyrophosphatase YjhB (NUDIX family)
MFLHRSAKQSLIVPPATPKQMNLFVNDIPIRILKPGKEPEKGYINHTVDAREETITKAGLINHVWIKKANLTDLDVVFELINSNVPTPLLSLVVSVDNYESVKIYVKKKFKVVQAAGGLIRKKDKFLMIYRLKKWDLPKGKKDSGEDYEETASREVLEECNIHVKLGKKICTTWHTYTMNKRSMIKKTRWYIMDCIDDSKARPQAGENIEEIRWMTRKEIYHSLENSYRSIQFVFEEYYRKSEKASAK